MAAKKKGVPEDQPRRSRRREKGPEKKAVAADPAGRSRGRQKGAKDLADRPRPETPGKADVPHPEAKPAKHPPEAARFPIVGIGASAGGLEALQEFFGHMPPDTGLGFVVVTHQHPGHVSLLPNLLSKATQMPVVEARDALKVEPNHVYVGPPGGLLAIAGGMLHRLAADSGRTPHLPIDYFFRSLATDQREHAICVVLSGTGTDGTLGMRAIKAESGMAMVQEPPSAKYAGMPASASATGLADYVLPAAAMAQQLIAYAKGPYLKPRARAVEAPLFPKEPLQRTLGLLRAKTGNDFSCYKTTTIQRRIERRMNVHQIKEPEGYIRYLQENPHEIDMLFAELLISVTSFFRDPQAFEALAEKALPELVDTRAKDHTMRVWVPGCASGEEAYSVAIVLHECMEKRNCRFAVQLFGTDLDAHAIEAARAGVYAAGITADVSKERLERYFTREDSVFRIRKEIREMLIFAPQNVIKDPPFTKLDLIVCRNLLIYLDVELQRRLLPVFHYALRPGGLLFLGPSESLGGFGDLFEVVDGRWKVFRRKEASPAVYPPVELPLEPRRARREEAVVAGVAGVAAPVRQMQTTVQVERLLLARFAPTTVVVDARGGIIYIHGRTGAYLEPTEGQPRNNILEMARRGLSQPLAAALREAAAENREVVREALRVKANGESSQVKLSVSPIDEPESLRGLFVVTIHPVEKPSGPAKPHRGKKAEARRSRVDELEQDLQYVKETLQTTIEELETSNEELKSTNEELQSTNEELQSSNEELETSKEEMQSLNEELSTVNVELQAKVDELSRTTDDMQNLLNSTQVATIFLDSDLRVKRYTEPARGLFNLIQTDLGRPLGHLTSNLQYDRLLEDCRDVLRALVFKETEVRAQDGSWHLMRIIPYRTAESVIDGVVLTFVEISRIRKAELETAAIPGCFESIVRTAREPMLLLDHQLRVAALNQAFCDTLGVTEPETAGKPIYEAAHRLLDIPKLRGVLEKVVGDDAPVVDFELDHQFPGIGQKVFLVTARRLDRGPDGPLMVAVSLVDATPKE